MELLRSIIFIEHFISCNKIHVLVIHQFPAPDIRSIDPGKLPISNWQLDEVRYVKLCLANLKQNTINVATLDIRLLQ
jgi:hypothetical protein